MTTRQPATEAGRRHLLALVGLGVATEDADGSGVRDILAIEAEARRPALDVVRREAQAIVDTVAALGPFRDETNDELDIDALETALDAAREDGS
jgi:hypothetical protein